MIKQIPVCRYEQLIPGRGVAVLLPDGSQAAVFRTAKDELYAVGNLDPATGAYVISRGLTGSRGGMPTVASPMLKHVYELASGRCVDGPAGPDPAHRLPTYPVLREAETVYVLEDPAIPRDGNAFVLDDAGAAAGDA
ncbi:nitrite reductase (NAD(P)H) small subunit [Actinospica sp. MGRD01-02]|uniref:Nitrite reductase (NAD(P)H) small subunit n=1 Tax=Actinospica acidithermotolerans TaxID=2828514 RepID=A0A941E3E8_9ACTN|nr:nitrite reductase (NAD(P)H) small subunit [Actinospica acidithermotolerans]MBR7825470.1 nitrite reductase (NAD(P)H) small subunit [Actinospica acidithermotolerans]